MQTYKQGSHGLLTKRYALELVQTSGKTAGPWEATVGRNTSLWPLYGWKGRQNLEQVL